MRRLSSCYRWLHRLICLVSQHLTDAIAGYSNDSMNCWMLSSCAVDPTLYVASDSHCKLLDADDRTSSSMTAAMITCEDERTPNLCRHWTFDERLDLHTDDDERFSPTWLHEQQLSAVNWSDVRSMSPTFSADHLDSDGLSRDLWTTLSPSPLLDNDDDAYWSGELLTRVDERGSYCSHTTGTSTDDGYSTSRCLSRDSTSVDASSPTLTISDGVAGSTLGSLSSSRSNSSDDVDVVIREPPARAWKGRRRRRQRRWSRQSSIGMTSPSQRITSRHLSLNASVHHGSHVLRSLLLHGSRNGGYRTPHQASTKSGRWTVSSESVRRIASTPRMTYRDHAARLHCLEDHCYFNRKQETMMDYSRISQCQTVSVTCKITSNEMYV